MERTDTTVVKRFFNALDRKWDALDRGQARRHKLLAYAEKVLGKEVCPALEAEREQLRGGIAEVFAIMQQEFQPAA